MRWVDNHMLPKSIYEQYTLSLSLWPMYNNIIDIQIMNISQCVFYFIARSIPEFSICLSGYVFHILDFLYSFMFLLHFIMFMWMFITID